MELVILTAICLFMIFLLVYTGIASKGIIDIAMGKKPVIGLPKAATKNKLSEDVDKSGLHPDLEAAPGIRDLLEEGRDDEAVDTYQKFAGVDEYTARVMVERIKREMDNQ